MHGTSERRAQTTLGSPGGRRPARGSHPRDTISQRLGRWPAKESIRQHTLAATSRVHHARPAEQHAMRAHRRRQPACGRMWPRCPGRISTDNASPRRHDGVRRAFENQIRARWRRARVGRGRGSALMGRSHVREDLPGDGGIVQRGDQTQLAPAIGTRQNIKRPVRDGRSAPGARTAVHPCVVGTETSGAIEAVGAGTWGAR